MTKLDRSYESHLSVQKLTLAPGEEWVPSLRGWSVIQVEHGVGYWFNSELRQQLETGAVVLFAGRTRGAVRASQLNGFTLHYFTVELERLTGLVTLAEQRFLEASGTRQDLSPQFLPPQSKVATKLKDLSMKINGHGFLFRLQLLQLFTEILGGEFTPKTQRPETHSDAKERLRVLLNEATVSSLLDMSFTDLVQRTHCTPRHLSRVFHEVVGMSFRHKQIELRLGRARELLATTTFKIVDVALESGYQSLSLFNLMFKRRFGMSPAKWRKKHQKSLAPNSQESRRSVHLTAA